MTSFVEIGNASLTLLGHYEYISSLSDSSPQAVTINANYERILRQCLRQHFWNFAMKRVVLAPSVSAPAWGTGKFFTLPSDFIRIHSINDDYYQQYNIEADGLYWEYDTILNLKYVAHISDPNKFDALFQEYYIASLARAIAPNITDSREKMRELRELELKFLSEARSTDGDEGGNERVWAETFIRSRV